MKRFLYLIPLCFLLAGCQQESPAESPSDSPAYTIQLSDNNILFEGNPISEDPAERVYIAHDIVYYPTGQDFTFGEGTEADAHEAVEADAHRVVHITKPGIYKITGKLSAGQIAVDLGKDAKKDPDAVVELILDNADITCTVAPAVIFYNVYECGDKDNPTKDVDTAGAGAIVKLSDNSVNNIQGSYVARIYKPDSVELNDAGTKVTDSKKLHKYDAAFYSKMSMNIEGNNGILNILAENEGLDSEMHLTINGGDIRIESGNDGINTNEDGVSVTTINDGRLTIQVNGSTGEGDGIDSNGWLVINGGTVITAAYGHSMDSGIDSDMGIHINGGTVLATGNMLDAIDDSEQNFVVFRCGRSQAGGAGYTLRGGDTTVDLAPANDFQILVYSSGDITASEYQLYRGEELLANSTSGNASGSGFPGGMGFPQGGMIPPEGMEMPQGSMPFPGGMTPPEGMEFPEGGMDFPGDSEFPKGDRTPPAGMEIPQGGMPFPGGMDFPQGGMMPPEGMERPTL